MVRNEIKVDTDVSSILKFNGYAETLRRTLDVVKKTAHGVDFVILGLENQQKVHYAMPLRHLVGDALGYLKEYSEIARRNEEAGQWDSADEFLSGLRKGDHLHPMVTLCVYYGEDVWDGPLSLTDMLEIPDWLKGIVSDYRMNLIQIRESEQFHFQCPDVKIVFEVCRNIYNRDYTKIWAEYLNREIDSELGLVIGAITESKELIRQALHKEGGSMNMCTALEELKQEGLQEGKIQGIVTTYREFGASQTAAAEKLKSECGLSEESAWENVKKYW